MRWATLPVVFLVCSALPAFARRPVGFLESGDGMLVRRVGDQLAVPASRGELLFEGDTVTTASPTDIRVCAASLIFTLVPAAEATVRSKDLRSKRGSIASRPASLCELPDIPDRALNGGRFYGTDLARSVTEIPFEQQLSALPADRREVLTRELSSVDEALRSDPGSISARATRVAILQRYELWAEAARDLRRLTASVPDTTVWPRALLHEAEDLQSRSVSDGSAETATGRTFAVIVGISQFPRLSPELQLQFADADARTIYDYLRSERGGSISAENILLLTNEFATTAAIRNGIATFLRARAGKQDRVLLFLAAHGTVEKDGGAYIVTYDSDPQDLRTTALPMLEIQRLMEDQALNVGRVHIWVDVCRAGTIGTIRSNDIHAAAESLLQTAAGDLEILGLVASRPGELSYEGARFGGGHGVFSYFLARGLNGDADLDRSSSITIDELIEYVRSNVRVATSRKQNPRESGRFENDSRIVGDLRIPGIELAGWTPSEASTVASRGPQTLADTTVGTSDPDEVRLLDAIDRGALLPGDPESAFTILASLRARPGMDPIRLQRLENRLRVALQEAGQKVLLTYLSGDRRPQNREDFAQGAAYFDAALQLSPAAQALESRALFCRGRELLFEKRFAEAAQLLTQALRLDPQGSYSLNALGIAYLEQAQFSPAIQAFRDAIRRAPYWAYPWHNLALAYSESGDFQAAIRAYREALRLDPSASYLAYNLGLLYQRLNQNRQAEQAFRDAQRLAPNAAEPYIALGFLRASSGRATEAESLYREALVRDPRSTAARHDLALLLSANGSRRPEAYALWSELLAEQPNYIPARLARAETYRDAGELPAAIREFEQVLRIEPSYTGARMEWARLLLRSGEPALAVVQYREALRANAGNSLILDELGDALLAAVESVAADEAWRQALSRATPEARKRINRKLKR